MEDNLSKYFRLAARVFASVVAFLLIVALIFMALWYMVAAYDKLPWAEAIFMAIVLIVPAAIFGTTIITFFFKTFHHPSQSVKYFSYFFFILLLLAWLAVLGIDFFTFFTKQYRDIDKYYSFNMLFLFLNVLVIFSLAVVQAFSTTKEKDWLEKFQERELKKNPPQ